MSQTTPPTVDALPIAPSTASPSTFAVIADAFVAALATFRTQQNSLSTNCYNNAVDCYNNAVAAASSASAASTSAGLVAAAGATAWVSGTTYSVGDPRYSPIDFQTYRRKTAGAGTTDPSADPTNWTRVLVGAGVGGSTITGSVTLTASSGAAISVTPTAPGLYLTLPVATTCQKAAPLYSVYNAGDYDYGVKDSAGTTLGWVRAKTGAMIGLADNTTSAGVWAYYGIEKTGLTAYYYNPTIANMSDNGQGTISRIALDTNRTLFIFGGTDCYGIIYDSSSQTWGSATLIRSSISSGAYRGILSNTNQVLVVTSNTTTGFNAVTLTLSGTTITVNTLASVVLGGNFASFGNLVAVGSSWVVSYGRATTTSGIRALTISGTTVTIGSESVVSSSTNIPTNIYASGSVIRTFVLSSSTVLATPYTVSGSSLTLGTAATASSTNTEFRTFLNGNGNIVAEYFNTTHYATIFKLTGTTEAGSSVSLGTVTTSLLNYCDYTQVSSGKALFTGIVSGNTWYANLLTDTAGTASAGTEISGSGSSGLTAGLVPYNVNGTLVSAAVACGSKLVQLDFDCSGSSAVLSATTSIVGSASYGSLQSSDKFGNKSSAQLYAGLSAIVLNSATGSSVGYGDTRYSSRLIQIINSLPLSAQPVTYNCCNGASNSETYITSTHISANTGFVIQKVEMAA